MLALLSTQNVLLGEKSDMEGIAEAVGIIHADAGELALA
jgi:hypothetical protein